MEENEKKIIRALEDNTRELLDLKLTLAHFTKLIGPELEKTDAIKAVQKRREEFSKEWNERFG